MDQKYFSNFIFGYLVVVVRFFLSSFHEFCKKIGFIIIELMKEIHFQKQLMKSRHEPSSS